MHVLRPAIAASLFLAAIGEPLLAQGMPTAQPNRVLIFAEHVKVGMADDHAAHEAGWPAAFARANTADYYLALQSMTGPSVVWYLSPYESYAAEAKVMKATDGDATLSAELSRLSRADAQYLDSAETFEAIGRPDLSHGAFPDLGLVRFYAIATFRIRLGHEQAFEAASKVYIANFKRAVPGGNVRAYQVINGMPGANYLFFTTFTDYAQQDKAMADGAAMWEGVSPKDMAILQKTMKDDILNIVSNRFQVSAGMSYVSADAKAMDPAFWNK
jgi:hypothetical protein